MEQPYIYVKDLREIRVQEGGIFSKTIQNDERSKVIQFCFAPGQELSAHTAPFPATLYFVSGKATLKLGASELEADEGTFVHMAPNLEHGISANTEVILLLTMLKNPPKVE
jgi:quercetin dioxygenase-like cupin family protein